MAIPRKEDVTRRIQQLEDSNVKNFRSKVEAAIERQVIHGGDIIVPTVGTPSNAIKRIISECEAGGWLCEHVSDQRDGDFLRIT